MKLEKSILKNNQTIQISGSKSISNRLLILEYLFGNILVENLSNSQDTELMQKALQSDAEVIDIHHAGTAMRFLTSYLSIQEGRTTVLTGSERMKQRPIKFLVDALRSLGAEIEYLENDGFPPLKIYGKNLEGGKVNIPANISSQFISSLLLIGGKLENGLEIELIGEITSRPYLEMTLKMLTELGIRNEFNENIIKIFHFEEPAFQSHLKNYEVESDWSSASYFYSMSAIGRKAINLRSFRTRSLQGDSALKEIYWDNFGVNTITDGAEYQLTLMAEYNFEYPTLISLNMNSCPDIAQTVCVTATALKIPFRITGLATLKVKETDRLQALKNELFKIGCVASITDDEIWSEEFFEPTEDISIKTYNDHRMAMSFAPFCLVKELSIENPEVVEKSYPDFWEDFKTITE